LALLAVIIKLCVTYIEKYNVFGLPSACQFANSHKEVSKKCIKQIPYNRWDYLTTVFNNAMKKFV